MRRIVNRAEIHGQSGPYGREMTSLHIEVCGPNDTATTKRGEPVWAHDKSIAVITSDDPDSPLYGEDVCVPLVDLLTALNGSSDVSIRQIADEAIGLYIEFIEQHGYEAEAAWVAAVDEVAEGLSVDIGGPYVGPSSSEVDDGRW